MSSSPLSGQTIAVPPARGVNGWLATVVIVKLFKLKVHALLHKSLLTALPSSHCSTPMCTTPSPQRAFWQETHASVSSTFASSHCSPLSTTESPEPAATQLRRHAFGAVLEFIAPLSHCSPGSTNPLPQASTTHDELHPSPVMLLPSSHCSVLARMKPSPQNAL